MSRDKVRAVERAVRELEFSRNEFARTLRTGTAATIGMLVTNISDPFFAAVIDAVEEQVRARDQLLLVASSSDDADEGIRVLRRLTRSRVDGLIVVVPETADLSFLQRQQDAGMPVVFVDQPSGGVSGDLVLSDNEGGMAEAVRHLAAAGHRRIACIAHVGGRYTSERRQDGYFQGLTAAGLAHDAALVVEVEDSVSACAAALAELTGQPDPATAVVTTNSRTTKAVLEALRLTRQRLSLVSFDDFDLAVLMDPPVTAIAQDPVAIGHAAADLLFDRIAGLGGAVRRIVIGTRLIERGSGEQPPR
ncbi:LacI family DNA-binding transcriptional regulator [Microbacterium invictum]